MAAGEKGVRALEQLDHPVLFTFLIALTVIFWLAVLTWIFKAHSWTGPAAATQHP